MIKIFAAAVASLIAYACTLPCSMTRAKDFALLPQARAEKEFNVDDKGVILLGYDAVSYFDADAAKASAAKDVPTDPLKGDPKWSTTYKGATYLFANEKNKQRFLENPEKFAPQYGGWCAYAVADSKSKVGIEPKSFLIQDGRLFVFYNGLLADTRKKWSKDPRAFLKKADANWPEVEHKKL